MANILLGSDCPTFDVSLRFQAQVDDYVTNFGECTTLPGALFIGGPGSDITDISGLANLTTINGLLDIREIPNLTSLDGLQNITTVGGLLEIRLAGSLANLDGLQNLTSINGDLRIRFNDALTNLDGLQNLTSINGGIFIIFNPLLSEWCGLHTLFNEQNNGVGSSMQINNNATNPTVMEIRDGDACTRILPEPTADAEELPMMPLPYLLLFILSLGGFLYFGMQRLRLSR